MEKVKLVVENKYPKPSLKEIENFEKEMKISLPQDYKDFLICYGGGEVEMSYISLFKSKYYEESLVITRFFELRELKEENKNNYNIIPQKNMFITIAEDGDKKNSLIISLTEKDYGKIFLNQNSFMPSKSYYKKYFNYNDDLILFADNFNEFINSFEELETFEFEDLCQSKKFEEAIDLVKNGLDVNATNAEDQKLIIIATNQQSQSLELTKFLIENGANVNEIDDTVKRSPLILSVIMGDNPDVVRYLVEHGADLKHKDELSEKTALEHAEKRVKNYPNEEHAREMYNILKEAEKKQKKKK